MRTVSKTAAAVLDTITADMDPGQARRIGEKGGAFMQVVVERLTESSYSVAHYYEQNGDLCPDPDMEFLRLGRGQWAPIAITQWSGRREALRLDGDEKITHWSPRLLADLCSFTTTWMRNIGRQQDLRGLPPVRN